MTTDERVAAIANTLEQSSGIIAALADSVANHDRRLDAILQSIEERDAQIATTDV